jgi:zinc protease
LARTALALALAAALLAPSAHAKPKVAPARKPAPKAAPAFQAFPYPIEQHTLKNGLRVAFVDYDSPGLVAYYTLMRVGSRNEPEAGRSGYAHFFEHMMFRGTKAHPADEYTATVTRLGLNTNAYTSNDMTVYHLYGPAQSLKTVIGYEADRFQNLDYTEQDFRTEAGAILGEYAKSASQPDLLLQEKLLGTAYTKHTYKHTVLGFLDDVKAMPEGFAYSREFFKRYYTPDDATVILVGDFDHSKALELITQAYGGWKGKSRPAAVAVEPAQTKAKRAHLDWPAQTLPRLWMAWHAPAASDLKATATQHLLDGYLFGPTSALYQDLILGRQLCESLESLTDPLRDPGLFGVAAEVKKAADLDAVEQAVVANLKLLASGKVDKTRLEAVRSNLKLTAALRLDTADRAAGFLARTAAVTGDLNYGNKLYAQVDKVTAKDLAAFAQRYLQQGNETTVTLTSAQKEVAK